jgi:hypothetical protein
MEPEVAKLTPDERPQLVKAAGSKKGPKRARKARASEEVARFFLAKDGSTPTKPELGDEADSESDALIKAFRSKGGVIYLVTAYRAEAEIQGGNPILVKRPIEK